MLENLLKAAVGVVITPVAVAADIATLGGTLADQEKPFTAQVVNSVAENLKDAIDPES